jgi:uncharacterized protein (TIGR02246 family)
MPLRALAVVAVVLVVAVLPSVAQGRSARSQIEATLNAWPTAWARGDADAVCGLFARNAVLVYPGGPDRTYPQACRQFRALIVNPQRRISYRRPAIRRVRVAGRLAAVRLVWTGTVRDAAGTVLERTREDGVDVMRRGRDGRWRIVLSHAFPLS